MRFHYTFIAVALLSLIAAGCPRASSVRPASGEHALGKTEQFIRNGLDFKLGHSQKSIIQTLGQPPAGISVKKIERQTTFAPQSPEDFPLDETIEMRYDGLHVRLFHAVFEDEELIQYLSITDEKYKVKWGLGIGSSRSAVKTVLGKPNESDAFTAIYQSRNTDSYVQFFFKDDEVYRIDWWHYFE